MLDSPAGRQAGGGVVISGWSPMRTCSAPRVRHVIDKDPIAHRGRARWVPPSRHSRTGEVPQAMKWSGVGTASGRIDTSPGWAEGSGVATGNPVSIRRAASPF